MGRLGRTKGLQEGSANSPHYVDLIPPPQGFADPRRLALQHHQAMLL
jgi:hypothetical protein